MSARSTGTGAAAGGDSKSSTGSRTARGQQQRSYGASNGAAWPIISADHASMYSSAIPIATQPFVETVYSQLQPLQQPQPPQQQRQFYPQPPSSLSLVAPSTQTRFLQTQHAQQQAAVDEQIKSSSKAASFGGNSASGGEQKWAPQQSLPSYYLTLPKNSSYLDASNTYRPLPNYNQFEPAGFSISAKLRARGMEDEHQVPLLG